MSNDVNKLKQRLEIRKYLVFAGMFLLFLGAMWLIFAPSEEEKKKEEKNAGFNTELPDPREAGIEGDKIAAYEQADMKRKQTEKLRTLEDFSGMADGNSGTVVELSPDADAKDGSSREGDRRNEACSSSVSAYNDINRTLGNFYESPQEDPEKEALKAEVEQLKQAVAAQNAQPGYEEQVALLEKSYELAARYMPGNGSVNTDSRSDNESPGRNGKAKAVPVGLVSTPVVSSLPQPVSDSIQLTGMAQPERFHTPIGHKEERNVRNTIRACIHGDQTVISGQGVRMRLLEPMRVGSISCPKTPCLPEKGAYRVKGFTSISFRWNMAVPSSPWNLPCMTMTDRAASSFRGQWRLTPSGRLPPIWGRISARASPSPTSRQVTSCFPNSERVPYKVSRSTYPGRCVKRRRISSQAIP